MQRFSDFYKNGKPTLSLEIFPPKSEKGVISLFEELALLKKMNPAYVSVTYGAMGSTRDLTKDLAIRIHHDLGINTAFHFTCVGSGRDDMKTYVTGLANEGINLVVALRGDKPAGMADFTPPPDGFRFANELVGYLKTLHPFSMAVAGYPEKHVEAKDLDDDLKNLKKKVDAGADIILTQLFFNNADYYSYVDKVRALGVTIPIIPGILPIQSLKQVQRITSLCGAKLSESLVKKLEACQDDENKMREVGVEHATAQCRDLLKNKVPGIHFYSLNKAYSVLKIVEGCKDLL
jgi:methylenetetrahydrofolate reductase (NADPH)